MMKTPFLVFLALIGLMLPVSAHLGETMRECELRYGSPFKSYKDDYGNETEVYLKNGFGIGITFLNGKAALIYYRHKNQNVIGVPDELSDNEIEILLKSNSPMPWKRMQIISMARDWQTEDGTVKAEYDPTGHILIILSKEMDDLMAASKKAKETENLKGL